MPRSQEKSALRLELEDRIRNGRCVYCRAPAAPDEPLTREHVIPRARGGRRKDLRIIVPACVDCNRRRGCQEIVLFLLARPRRISAFLEYLAALPTPVLRALDLRVFAELYAAIWLLGESLGRGQEWRAHLERACTGRRLHRRRYAARRLLASLELRLERAKARSRTAAGASCLLPEEAGTRARGMEHSCEEMGAMLMTALSTAWEIPAETVLEELSRAQAAAPELPTRAGEEAPEVLRLDAWRGRPRARRLRVDRRGRGAGRGRAA